MDRITEWLFMQGRRGDFYDCFIFVSSFSLPFSPFFINRKLLVLGDVFLACLR